MNSDTLGCLGILFLFILMIAAIVAGVQNDNRRNESYRIAKESGITTVDTLSICFNEHTYTGTILSDMSLSDFILDNDSYYIFYKKRVYYTFKNCTFTDMEFNLDKLEYIQFIDCKFINTKFKHTYLENILFLNCIYEEVEFNNVIFGKEVKYYEGTISTITLVENTFLPEHIKDGVNQFELFVEGSME